MSSPFFMSQLPTTPKHMVDLQPMQTLLFDTCIEFMYWQPYEDSLVRRQGLTQICDAHLTMLVRMMSSLSFSEPVVRLASLVSPDYFDLVRHCVAMLGDGKVASRDRILLDCMCHLTNHVDLLTCMQGIGTLKPSLLTLIEAEDSEILFNAYRILALIMCEDDVKKLKNAHKIVEIFYLYIISMLEDPIQRMAFEALLRSLNSKRSMRR